MTRLLNDGAENGDGLFFEAGGVAVTSSTKRSGTYSYGSQGAFGANPTKYLASGLSEFFIRFGDYFENVGGDAFTAIRFRQGSTDAVTFWVGTDGYMHFNVGSDQKTTSNLVYTNTWHLLEMHVKIAASGILELKFDGIADTVWEGDTRGNSLTYINRLFWDSGSHLGSYPYHFFDDIALNDTYGSKDNSWCGDGHYTRVYPANNGAYSQWYGNDGDQTNNYLLEDEVPPDGDVTYVRADSSNAKDAYVVSGYVGTNKTILRVIPEARARDYSALGQQMRVGYRFGGTDYMPSGFTTIGYNYQKVDGLQDITLNPSGEIWDETDLATNIQVVIEAGTIV